MAGATSWPVCANLSVARAQTQLTSTAVALTMVQPTSTCCSAYNTSGLPQWFVDQMLMPYQSLSCQRPFGFKPNSTTYLVVDRYSWQLADVRKICPIAFQLFVYKFVNLHYYLFYGFGIPINSYTPAAQLLACFLQLAAYLTPLALTIMIFGLGVVWRVLKKSEATQLFVYHTALLFVDMFLYVFSVFNSSIGTAVIGWMGCMASAYLAVGFDGFAGSVISVMLISQYCFANIIQAILAADRACGVLAPVFYRAYASGRVAGMAVLLAFAINSLLTVAEILLIESVTCALLVSDIAVFPSDACVDLISRLRPLVKVVNAVRFLLFLGTVSVQAGCCMAMLITIRRMKRSAAAGGAGVSAISLTPCYMLIGTCCLNAIGGITETVFLFMRQFSAADMSPAVALVFNFLWNWRFALLPLCNSCGMWAHCIASRKYREEVVLIFAPFVGLARRFRPAFRSVQVATFVAAAANSSTNSSHSDTQQRTMTSSLNVSSQADPPPVA